MQESLGLHDVLTDGGSDLAPTMEFTCNEPVRIHGLQEQVDLNGKEGHVVGFDISQGRWRISLNGVKLLFKSCNLEHVTPRKYFKSDWHANGDIRPGSRVCMLGLTARLDLNGQEATVIDRAAAPPVGDRWRVELDIDGTEKQIDRRNLFLLEARPPGSVVPPFVAGDLVRVCGLTVRPELNGEIGSLVGFDKELQRWKVQTSGPQRFSLKAANLRHLHVACPRTVPERFYIGDAREAMAREAEFVQWKPGNRVAVVGLASTDEVLEKVGTLQEWDACERRWRVVLDDGGTMQLGPVNLRELKATGSIASLKASAQIVEDGEHRESSELEENEISASDHKKSCEEDTYQRIKAMIGGDLHIGLLGTAMRHPASTALLQVLAPELLKLPDWTSFVTHGAQGAQELFARYLSDTSRVWNLIPEGEASGYSVGTDVCVGVSVKESRRLFGRLGDVYITIEGGPAVAEDAESAAARGAFVLPLARTGGASQSVFKTLHRPSFASEEQWALLATTSCTVEETAAAAQAIVAAAVEAEAASRNVLVSPTALGGEVGGSAGRDVGVSRCDSEFALPSEHLESCLCDVGGSLSADDLVSARVRQLKADQSHGICDEFEHLDAVSDFSRRTERCSIRHARRVRIVGLTHHYELNGHEATVIGWSTQHRRWKVITDDGAMFKIKSLNLEGWLRVGTGQLKPVNLALAAAARAGVPLETLTEAALSVGRSLGPSWDHTEQRWLSVADGGKIKDNRRGPQQALWESMERGALQKLSFDTGDRVRVFGLGACADLNGHEGDIVSFDQASWRWKVRLDSSYQMLMLIKGNNLERVLSKTKCGSFERCQRVRLVGLHVRELNGQEGTLTSWSDAQERWKVCLDCGEKLMVSVSNLTSADDPQGYLRVEDFEMDVRFVEAWKQLHLEKKCVEDIPMSAVELSGSISFTELPLGGEATSLEVHGVPDDGNFMPGERVCIKGFITRHDLNGQLGTLVAWDTEQGRWKVRMDDGSGKVFNVRNFERHVDHISDITELCTPHERPAIATGQRIQVEGFESGSALNGLRGVVGEWCSRQLRWSVRVDGGSTLILHPTNLTPCSEDLGGHVTRCELRPGTRVLLKGLVDRPDANRQVDELAECVHSDCLQLRLRDLSEVAFRPEQLEPLVVQRTPRSGKAREPSIVPPVYNAFRHTTESETLAVPGMSVIVTGLQGSEVHGQDGLLLEETGDGLWKVRFKEAGVKTLPWAELTPCDSSEGAPSVITDASGAQPCEDFEGSVELSATSLSAPQFWSFGVLDGPPSDLVALIETLSREDVDLDSHSFRKTCLQVLLHTRSFSIKELVSVVRNLAALQVRDVSMFDQLAAEICRRSDELETADAVALLDDFARVRLRNQEILRSLTAILRPGSLGDSELVRCVVGFEVLRWLQGHYLQMASHEVGRRCFRLGFDDLVQLAWALSHHASECESVLESVSEAVDALAVRPEALEVRKVSALLDALPWLLTRLFDPVVLRCREAVEQLKTVSLAGDPPVFRQGDSMFGILGTRCILNELGVAFSDAECVERALVLISTNASQLPSDIIRSSAVVEYRLEQPGGCAIVGDFMINNGVGRANNPWFGHVSALRFPDGVDLELCSFCLALSELCELATAGGAELGTDRMSGYMQFFLTDVPSLSSLAAFQKFRCLFPQVTLGVAFAGEPKRFPVECGSREA